MKRSPVLGVLTRLAGETRDAAAEELGYAVGAVQTAEQKLGLLEQYRDEYAARLEAGLSGGLTATEFRNFRAFIDKIDEAIEGQREMLQKAAGAADVARDNWRDAAQRQKSFTTLAARDAKQAREVEARQQQKQTDEHAGRSGLRRG